MRWWSARRELEAVRELLEQLAGKVHTLERRLDRVAGDLPDRVVERLRR